MKTLDDFLEIKENYLRKIVKYFPEFITANSLTMARFVLLPLIIYLIIVDQYTWALLTFLFAFLLDLFDGPLARHRKTTTVFGAMLDPLADKILFMSVLVLVAYQNLPMFLLATIIALEVIIMFLAGVLAPIGKSMKLKFKIGANKYGKYKMFLQVVGLVILLINPESAATQDWAILIFSVAVLFAGMSIGDHCRSIIK